MIRLRQEYINPFKIAMLGAINAVFLVFCSINFNGFYSVRYGLLITIIPVNKVALDNNIIIIIFTRGMTKITRNTRLK